MQGVAAETECSCLVEQLLMYLRDNCVVPSQPVRAYVMVRAMSRLCHGACYVTVHAMCAKCLFVEAPKLYLQVKGSFFWEAS